MKVTIYITSDGQGCFTAICPTLPGCLSKAATAEQAQEKLREVMRGYLAAVSNFVPENIEPELVEQR